MSPSTSTSAIRAITTKTSASWSVVRPLRPLDFQLRLALRMTSNSAMKVRTLKWTRVHSSIRKSGARFASNLRRPGHSDRLRGVWRECRILSRRLSALFEILARFGLLVHSEVLRECVSLAESCAAHVAFEFRCALFQFRSRKDRRHGFTHFTCIVMEQANRDESATCQLSVGECRNNHSGGY